MNSELIETAKDLLNYGLKLDSNNQFSVEHSYIKSLLVNSRILIESQIELDNHLAIIFYLTKDIFSFIYSYKYYLDDTNYIYHYFLIK